MPRTADANNFGSTTPTDEVRDDQRHREGCTQGEQCECIDDGGHNSDDDRADGVREEDFQQLHVGGDQRDQVALAFARKFGRGETPQGREGFRTEQCEQPERHIVVHELFGIAHAAADQRADGHGGERCGNAEIPDRASRRPRKPPQCRIPAGKWRRGGRACRKRMRRSCTYAAARLPSAAAR